MNDLAIRAWTLDEFFAWQEGQEERYELVSGFPLRMMTGASNRHDVIVVNLTAELRLRLRGSGCRPFSADTGVETFRGQIRRPDVGIHCGEIDLEDFVSRNPIVVFEVLSPSTRDFDRFRKIWEYMAVSSIRHIVFVETREPLIYLWTRDDRGDWSEETVRDINETLVLRAIDIALTLSEIYQDVRFPISST